MEKAFNTWYINSKKLTNPKKHIDSLKQIGKQLYSHGIIDEPNILNLNSVAEIEKLQKAYFNIDEYALNDKKGKGMWRSAFKNYIAFLESKD